MCDWDYADVMKRYNELKSAVSIALELIEPYFPKEEGYQKNVMSAMNYSLLAGGKRLRPIFMMESYKFFGGKNLEYVSAFMAALEMIHTYSLIHDDLPAMDNDDYRRGRLTNHKVYGEATAILAGDGLLNYAFETVANKMCEVNDPSLLKRMVRANRVLGKKAGIYGMIGGQVVDLESENNPNTDKDTLLFIHECKTAALIEAALMIGAVLAGANEMNLAKIERVGYNIGLAFQIQDDILDVIGDQAVIGKPVLSDEKNNKTTYVTIHGLDESKKRVEELSLQSIKLLDSLPYTNEFLNQLIKALINRDK